MEHITEYRELVDYLDGIMDIGEILSGEDSRAKITNEDSYFTVHYDHYGLLVEATYTNSLGVVDVDLTYGDYNVYGSDGRILHYGPFIDSDGRKLSNGREYRDGKLITWFVRNDDNAFHCISGPALIMQGREQYFLFGIRYNFNAWKAEVKKLNLVRKGYKDGGNEING